MDCSVGFCLMTEAVLAMDEFSYQKSSLEGHIAHCAAKGLPLTSPLTGEPMGGMFLPNQNLRTLVKDYIYQRQKEWGLLFVMFQKAWLHLEPRRVTAAAESGGREEEESAILQTNDRKGGGEGRRGCVGAVASRKLFERRQKKERSRILRMTNIEVGVVMAISFPKKAATQTPPPHLKRWRDWRSLETPCTHY
jgi:hypothetical protein